MKLFHNFSLRSLHKVVAVAVLASVAFSFSSCKALPKRDLYEPWPSLSKYFDLDKVSFSNNIGHFNTYEISKERYERKPIDWGDYTATVLGMGVLLRSQPIISPYTRLGSVNTGDFVEIIGPAEYNPSNGKWWNRVQVQSGVCQGYSGYICNDYLISQEKYYAFERYVFPYQGSNISYRNTDSKYLNAISDVLLKFEVNQRNPQLYIQLKNVKNIGYKQVVTFQIYDMLMRRNNSMLAFIEFVHGENNFVVLGVVPGSNVCSIEPTPNGSYDISYYL